MAITPRFLFSFLIVRMFPEVQFFTNLKNDSDTPTFEKAFVFKYQAVTSESENKARAFSPFPRKPEINLTEAYSLVADRVLSETIEGMNTVKRCQNVRVRKCPRAFLNRMNEQLIILDEEKKSAETKADRNCLIEIATLFLPQQSMLAVNTGSGSPKAIGLNAAVASDAGLVLGDTVKDAACSALSILSLCSDSTELEADVNSLLQHQTVFQETLERVQNRNDENFFQLGNEIQETQKTNARITEFVNDNLQKLDVELRGINGVISLLVG